MLHNLTDIAFGYRAFFRLSLNIFPYSSVCSVAAGFKNGCALVLLVPISTSLCYRKGFLSPASCSLLSCKFGVHYHPTVSRMSSTLGDIIASITLSLYALRCQRSADYLGIGLLSSSFYRFCLIFQYTLLRKGAYSLRCILNICADVYFLIPYTMRYGLP